jgi:hypothetical protein
LYDETLAIFARNDPNASPPPYLLANRAKALRSLGRYTQATNSYERCVQRAASEPEAGA